MKKKLAKVFVFAIFFFCFIGNVSAATETCSYFSKDGSELLFNKTDKEVAIVKKNNDYLKEDLDFFDDCFMPSIGGGECPKKSLENGKGCKYKYIWLYKKDGGYMLRNNDDIDQVPTGEIDGKTGVLFTREDLVPTKEKVCVYDRIVKDGNVSSATGSEKPKVTFSFVKLTDGTFKNKDSYEAPASWSGDPLLNLPLHYLNGDKVTKQADTITGKIVDGECPKVVYECITKEWYGANGYIEHSVSFDKNLKCSAGKEKTVIYRAGISDNDILTLEQEVKEGKDPNDSMGFKGDHDLPLTDAKGCDILKDLNSEFKVIFRTIQMILIGALIALTILDFIKAMAASKDDELKKASKKLITRIIIIVIIFILPLLVKMILGIFFGGGFDACLDAF